MILLVLALLAGQDARDDPDCAGNTVQMVECSKRSMDRAERALDGVSQQARTMLKARDQSPAMEHYQPDSAGCFQRAQQAWRTFRDAHCRVAASGSLGGTIYPLELMGCKERMTRQRIVQIRSDVLELEN